MNFNITVNGSRYYICPVMRIKSMLGFVIVAILFLACSESRKQEAINSSDDSEQSTHLAHDSTAVAISDGGALPVVNRPHYRTVEIKLMKFNPSELTVSKGDTVVWVNNGITAHDVTAYPEPTWTSSSMPTGTSWQMIVNESSEYYCSIHVVMKGKLVVK